MPPHHLTITHPVIEAVQQVIAGTPPHMAAAAANVHPADLADAVETYHAAGLAALHQQPYIAWYQVLVEFPDWDAAEHVGVEQLGPGLDRLHHVGAIDAWWFLRKHPRWRLRIRTTNPTLVDDLLDDLAAEGAITNWWPTLYEPEATAFGGDEGIRIVHDLFCADSRGVLAYLTRPAPGLGRRELSLLLLGGLLHTAGIDWFERGDVFAKVAFHRPADTDDSGIRQLAPSVRGLLAAPPDPDSPLFQPDGVVGHCAPWLTAHLTAGRRLAQAATAGMLGRGLRNVIAHIVIFHWNRLGLSAHTQGILARAAVEAFLPQD